MEARFRELRTIGRGNYGVCLLVEDTSSRATPREVLVMKKVAIEDMPEAERLAAMQEVTLLAALKHPCIVEYRGSFTSSGVLHILMQYCEGGDLSRRIKAAKAAGAWFTEDQILDWGTQLILAIAFCHRLRCIHRDIKVRCQRLRRHRKVGGSGCGLQPSAHTH